jgi:hypothetical protein
VSRDLSSGVSSTLNDDVIYPFFAVELNFDSGTFTAADGTTQDRVLRLWTGLGTLTYDGNQYFGTGNMLDISSIEESTEIAAKGATITLSGVPSQVVSLALSEQYQGRECTIYFGMTSSQSSLTEVFTGYMDQMSIDEGPESSTVQLTVENKLIDLERPRVGRFTSEYQKSIYSEDKGFDFVESLQEQKLTWGRAGV